MTGDPYKGTLKGQIYLLKVNGKEASLTRELVFEE